MYNQKLAPNALSIEQINHVKGGISSSELYSYAKKGYDVAKWSYNHRSQISSAAKSTYNVSKKVVGFVKSWF